MPNYDYVCTNVGCLNKDRVVNVTRSVDDRDKEVLCADCGGPLERQISSLSHIVIVGSNKGDRNAAPTKRTVK